MFRKPAPALLQIVFVCLVGVRGVSGQDTTLPSYRIEGAVQDQSGASIPHAEVILSGKGFREILSTDREGKFLFQGIPVESLQVTVRANGFQPAEQLWNAPASAPLAITLAPLSRVERVMVTATRTEQRVSDTAASVAVLSKEDLAATAALALDGALCQVPGFLLFRRSGSLVANPTSQGVSLRGVGASGASRALVLEDGIPLNDPFGGWVYWDRVPKASVESVEVVEGGVSDLYGTDALGGVINIRPSRPASPSLDFEASYGNQQTPDAALSAGVRRGAWLALVSAEALRTGGYILVDARERGSVDTPAGSEHTTAVLDLERKISESSRFFAQASLYQESRRNGTPLQRNRTHLRQLAAGADWQAPAWGTFSFRGYGGPELFNQDFSAIATDRDGEVLTRSQRVPAQQMGGSAQWSRPGGARQTLAAGWDGYAVRGASDELVFSSGGLTSAVGAGGRQHTSGFFGEDILRLTPAWMLQVGARFDSWRNFDALSTTRPLATLGPILVTRFADRTEQALSPRLAVLHRVTEHLVFRASGYRAFRAPSLNELYRTFRLGNVLTLANDGLRAERLTGGEAGASLSVFQDKLAFRGTIFWSEIARPIANVTLRVQPNLITRQRENLGKTRSRGAQAEASARLSSAWTLSGGYQFADATVVRFPADTTLEGLLIPHVPRHTFTLQARYSSARWLTAGVQGRYEGAEFDDDQNRLRLNRCFTLDGLVSRSLRPGIELFAAAQNLLDQRCDVGRTPVLTQGPPALVRAGLRVAIR